QRRPVDLRVALGELGDGDRGEIVRAHGGEGAAVAAEGRANGVADEGVGHRGETPEDFGSRAVAAIAAPGRTKRPILLRKALESGEIQGERVRTQVAIVGAGPAG